jgi:ketosteroid isomerase-like protein
MFVTPFRINQRTWHFKLCYLFLSFLLIMGCKQKIALEDVELQDPSTSFATANTPKHIAEWVIALAEKDESAIEMFYDSNAISVISQDSIITGATKIASYYGDPLMVIDTIESVCTILANPERQIHYEVLHFASDKKEEYTQLLIWKKKGENFLREFEFTEMNKMQSEVLDTNEISVARKRWVELCNLNNAETLVKEMYSFNTLYFNHKPIVSGIDALIQEYNYMNGASYSLDLQPLHLISVNANTAIEIGQCKGSYGGNYILVWKKQKDGHWKIYIDSNI